MKYLNKSNMPKRITAKQMQAYVTAKAQGLTANEAYNKDVLGISSALYHWIRVAEQDVYGILGPSHVNTLAQINFWLKNGGHRYDENNNLLSYLDKLYRI